MRDSTTSAGLHKKGSARAYVQSGLPTAGLDRDGKIWLDSSTSRAYILRDSARTNYLAFAPVQNPVVISYNSTVTPAVDAQLVMISLHTRFVTNTNQNRPYYGIVFDDIPTITCSGEGAGVENEIDVSIFEPSTSHASFKAVDVSTSGRESTWTLHALIVGHVSNFS
jgi:hypothetical protein